MTAPEDPPPRRRLRRFLRVTLIVVAGLALVATAFVMRSRLDQDLALPAAGQTLPTTVPRLESDGRELVSESTIRQGHMERRATIRMPSDIRPGERLPVVVVLHGVRGNPADAAKVGFWGDRVVDTRLIAVLPAGEYFSWNAGGCCRLATLMGVDDVAYLDAIVTDMKRRPEVDPSRVFMVGESNGGMLVYRYLCHHAADLAGAVSMFGTNVSGCQPNAPVPLMHVHGMADPVVPYHGGVNRDALLLGSGSFPSVPDTVAQIAATEGCRSRPTDSVRDEIVEVRDWDGCGQGSRVRLVSIGGMTHHWPGTPFPGATEILRFFGLRS